MLPTVEQLVRSSVNYKVSVKIIQNGECNRSKHFVHSKFPHYDYLAVENQFLFSYNPIVKTIKSEFIFILNDDLKLSSNILNESIPLFKDKSLFAVSCLFFDWGTNHVQFSGSTFSQTKSWLHITNNKNIINSIEYCFFSSGGASIYRTEMFNKLKGFDEIYSPAYYEDTDLSHRAWLKGWPSIINPKATVEHRQGTSWNNSKKAQQLKRLRLRNKMIGMLVNSHSQRFFILFWINFPYRVFFSLIRDRAYLIANLDLLKMLGKIISKRRHNKEQVEVSKDFMLEKIGNPYP